MSKYIIRASKDDPTTPFCLLSQEELIQGAHGMLNSKEKKVNAMVNPQFYLTVIIISGDDAQLLHRVQHDFNLETT